MKDSARHEWIRGAIVGVCLIVALGTVGLSRAEDQEAGAAPLWVYGSGPIPLPIVEQQHDCLEGATSDCPDREAVLTSDGAMVTSVCLGANYTNDAVECDKEWDQSRIDLSGCSAPSGATVKSVSYAIEYLADQGTSKGCPDCYGQLDVRLCNSTRCAGLHDAAGACCLVGSQSRRKCELSGSTNLFDDDPVKQEWRLETKNYCDSCAGFELDVWHIAVYYYGPTSTPAPTPTKTPFPTSTCTPDTTPSITPAPPTTPSPTLTPVVDLVADALEVTQAVQDLNNSVRLVANKRTFVRFHVHSQDDTYPTLAMMTADNGSSTTALYPINFIANVRPSPIRAAWSHAFLFELPTGYKDGTVTLTAELNPSIAPIWDRDPPEMDYSNNTVSTTVQFESVPPLDLVIYRVGAEYLGTNYAPPQSHVDMLVDYLKRAFPVSSVNVWQRYSFYGEAEFKPDSHQLKRPNCFKVNRRLYRKRRYDRLHGAGIPSSARYYGMVYVYGGFMRGCARSIPSHVSSGGTSIPASTYWDNDGCMGDWYGAHELGHCYGRYHAPCDVIGHPTYPYPGARISPEITGDEAIFGFDIGTKQVYGPLWRDLMSYCENLWISDYHYEKLMHFFRTHPTSASGERLTIDQTDRLLVTGSIDPALGEVDLDPLFIVPDAGDVEPRVPGDYAVVLRDSMGEELARYPFTPENMVDGAPPPDEPPDDECARLLFVSELVPYVGGAAAVEIEDAAGILARVAAGPSDPTVTILSPNGGESLTGDPIIVSWSAGDPDGDPLTFNVEYSRDDGLSWEMLAQDLTETSLELDAINVGSAAQGRFRVWVSDGIHTASDQSDGPFTVPNHDPTVEIREPSGPVTVAVGQTLTLRGSAYDIDTGSMAGEQLEWTSSLDGYLGTGDLLSVAGLSEGTHTVTLEADDGQGGTAQDQVQVTVVGDVTQLPAEPDRLLAGPSLLTFSPTEGLTMAQLAIDNQNPRSSIAWGAEASETWIQLGASSGVTPQQISASLDDTGLGPGLHAGNVTVTSPDTPGESVTVRVEALIRGCSLHLPVVLKA